MSSGFEFQLASYTTMPVTLLETLYSMSKKIFSDRLEWKVRVSHAFEFDEYDNAATTYLVGSWKGVPLAGLRLINTCDPYMLEGPFRSFLTALRPKMPPWRSRAGSLSTRLGHARWVFCTHH